jgi:hypothetical protein
MNKYEHLIIYFFGILFLVVFWIIRFRKIHNPKDLKRKDIYLKSLCFRFYLDSFIIMGLIFTLIREFFKLYNE